MCPDCGSEFTSGFGLINHKKLGKCNVQAVNTQLQDDLYEDFEIQHDLYEDSEISEWEPDNASLDIQATAAEVDGYMDSLRQMGTYDDKAVHQYLGLPARKPSAVEKEVCHFLHAVDHRQGTSNERTDKVLRYVKKLGGTAMLSPKKAKTCWEIVKKIKECPVNLNQKVNKNGVQKLSPFFLNMAMSILSCGQDVFTA